MTRADAVALATGALVGALLAASVVFVSTAASRPAEFPTSAVSLPSPFVAPTPTVVPALPITLQPDGLGLVSFGAPGEAVVADLEALLGAPNSDEGWTCPEPPGDVHFVQWRDLGVFVIDGVFVGWVDAIYFPPEYGPLLELKMAEDLHIGILLEHFEAHLGDRFAFRPADQTAAEGAARPFDIDGPAGIQGFVEEGAEGSRVIALSAGTTCFDNAS